MSTQWEHWKAELELFCQNYCKLMEPKKKEALKPAAAPLQALTHPMEVDGSNSQNLRRSESNPLGTSMETEEGAQGACRQHLPPVAGVGRSPVALTCSGHGVTRRLVARVHKGRAATVHAAVGHVRSAHRRLSAQRDVPAVHGAHLGWHHAMYDPLPSCIASSARSCSSVSPPSTEGESASVGTGTVQWRWRRYGTWWCQRVGG